MKQPNQSGGRRWATEVEFALPRGFRDGAGELHVHGVMRAMRVGEEIRVLGDFRVFMDPQLFLSVALARAIARLGTLPRVTVGTIDGLHPDDRAHLEQLYLQMNGYGDSVNLGEVGELTEANKVRAMSEVNS